MKISTTVKDLAVMISSAIVFVSCALLPFMIHASTYDFVIGTFSTCDVPNQTQVIDKNQCINWVEPLSASRAEVLDVIAVGGLALLTLAYVQRQQSRTRIRQFGLTNACISILMAILTASIYGSMRSMSQDMLTSANKLPSGGWKIIHPAAFGFGVPPATIVIITGLYTSVALALCYKFLVSPYRIAGVKKDALFS